MSCCFLRWRVWKTWVWPELLVKLEQEHHQIIPCHESCCVCQGRGRVSSTWSAFFLPSSSTPPQQGSAREVILGSDKVHIYALSDKWEGTSGGGYGWICASDVSKHYMACSDDCLFHIPIQRPRILRILFHLLQPVPMTSDHFPLPFVAYHGTDGMFLSKIQDQGLKEGVGMMGPAVYVGNFRKACRFAALTQDYKRRKRPILLRLLIFSQNVYTTGFDKGRRCGWNTSARYEAGSPFLPPTSCSLCMQHRRRRGGQPLGWSRSGGGDGGDDDGDDGGDDDGGWSGEEWCFPSARDARAVVMREAVVDHRACWRQGGADMVHVPMLQECKGHYIVRNPELAVCKDKVKLDAWARLDRRYFAYHKYDPHATCQRVEEGSLAWVSHETV